MFLDVCIEPDEVDRIPGQEDELAEPLTEQRHKISKRRQPIWEIEVQENWSGIKVDGKYLKKKDERKEYYYVEANW